MTLKNNGKTIDTESLFVCSSVSAWVIGTWPHSTHVPDEHNGWYIDCHPFSIRGSNLSSVAL